MNKIKGFTLAEILITLAIIGVVAALTIPSVIVKSQKVQFYNGFVKAYNTLNTVYKLAENENGPMDTWGADVSSYSSWSNAQVFENYILPKLKVAYKCSDNDSCKTSGIDRPYMIDGLSKGRFQIGYVDNIYILQDGSSVSKYSYDSNPGVAVDVNGIKGPNFVGKDVFFFNYIKINVIIIQLCHMVLTPMYMAGVKITIPLNT